MSQKRGSYNSPRQKERRREILAAAVAEMQEHGLSSVTMNNIAQSSNVSTKTLYNLYGSRNLLLLEATSVLLEDLEESKWVQSVEPGIPRLLAYTERAMRVFDYGEFTRPIFNILLSAEPGHAVAKSQLGRMQRIAYSALCIAADKGELLPDINLHELSHILAANQWGVALLWEKGMISLEQLKRQTTLSHYLTLAPACRGERKTMLLQECQTRLTYQSEAHQPEPDQPEGDSAKTGIAG
jgi:AcrR family transcriptional regulator